MRHHTQYRHGWKERNWNRPVPVCPPSPDSTLIGAVHRRRRQPTSDALRALLLVHSWSAAEVAAVVMQYDEPPLEDSHGLWAAAGQLQGQSAAEEVVPIAGRSTAGTASIVQSAAVSGQARPSPPPPQTAPLQEALKRPVFLPPPPPSLTVQSRNGPVLYVLAPNQPGISAPAQALPSTAASTRWLAPLPYEGPRARTQPAAMGVRTVAAASAAAAASAPLAQQMRPRQESVPEASNSCSRPPDRAATAEVTAAAVPYRSHVMPTRVQTGSERRPPYPSASQAMGLKHGDGKSGTAETGLPHAPAANGSLPSTASVRDTTVPVPSAGPRKPPGPTSGIPQFAHGLHLRPHMHSFPLCCLARMSNLGSDRLVQSV